MKERLGKLGSWLTMPPPSVGIEIAPRRVTAVAISRRPERPVIVQHWTQPLPEGAVVPTLTAPNIVDPPAVTAALKQAVGKLGVRFRRVGLVVPDSLAKVSLVRFDKVPARSDDLDQLIRWQVRKAAPFRIEEAQVAYSPASRLPEGGREFVVTLARREILEEYERVCSAVGASAGLVDLATFGLINLVLSAGRRDGDTNEKSDWLLVNVTSEYSTIAIVRDTDLVFFRNRRTDADGNLADLVHQTTMYYEDRLEGHGFARALLGGAAASGDGMPMDEAEQLRLSLEHRVGCPVETMDLRGAASLGASGGGLPDALDALASPMGLLLRESPAT